MNLLSDNDRGFLRGKNLILHLSINSNNKHHKEENEDDPKFES